MGNDEVFGPRRAYELHVPVDNKKKQPTLLQNLFAWTASIGFCFLLFWTYRNLLLPRCRPLLTSNGENYTHLLDKILKSAPLIDGHNDWPIWMRVFHGDSLANVTLNTSIDGQVDFPRLRKGRLGAQFWSVYVECPSIEELGNISFPDTLYYENIHDTLQQIDFMKRLIRRFPRQLQAAYTAKEVYAIHAAHPERIASLLGIEGLHQIGNSAAVLRQYYELGVRYATLTHDCHNKYADSAEPVQPYHGGLSEAGKVLIWEMNRIGMAIDLAHVSAATMRDVLQVSKAPVMITHSGAYSICAHRRNVPDDVLDLISKHQGVVMVPFYPAYIRCEPEADKANLSDVADHIEYIGRRIGFNHVGIGSDFDGMSRGVDGLEDVSKYPALLLELLRRGLGRRRVEQIASHNVLRVLALVEDVAADLSYVEPIEDHIAHRAPPPLRA